MQHPPLPWHLFFFLLFLNTANFFGSLVCGSHFSERDTPTQDTSPCSPSFFPIHGSQMQTRGWGGVGRTSCGGKGGVCVCVCVYVACALFILSLFFSDTPKAFCCSFLLLTTFFSFAYWYRSYRKYGVRAAFSSSSSSLYCVNYSELLFPSPLPPRSPPTPPERNPQPNTCISCASQTSERMKGKEGRG